MSGMTIQIFLPDGDPKRLKTAEIIRRFLKGNVR